MINLLYSDFVNSKGLLFWNKEQIQKRGFIKDYLVKSIENILLNINQAWKFEEWEAPILTPPELINKNYKDKDYFNIIDINGRMYWKELSLRPETTNGSYIIARKLLQEGYKLPLCIYQAGKSFRREQSEQSMQKHKRFTEFYQLEFQCLYSSNSKANYYQEIIDKLPKYIEKLLKINVRVIQSDTLPDYSNKTFDIEAETPEKWLEICSISDRKDYACDIKNIEIAFGLDRLILV